ncbi:MAG: protein-L-isoaspartate(D-aspartate) O-methyltransferase [Pseudomonadales bacterium]
MLSEIQGVGMTSMRTRERLISRLYEEGITNPKVLDCIRSLPRHLFVDEALAHRAYEDTALPIGYSQTLSQPYVVARMTELLLSRGVPERVLEIGTGSGYQTAVLSQLVKRVYTVERIAPLLEKARQRFQDLGMRNVFTRHSDGGMGWPEKGPFNAILSAAAPPTIPQELLDQLAPDGVLVIPVGGDEQQMLQMVVREGDTVNFETTSVEPVRFVPLLSGLRG